MEYIIVYEFQNRELNDENLMTRQRAVMSLCDHLHDPEHIAEALKVGMLNILLSISKACIRLIELVLRTIPCSL